jgi:hypothetical protein
VARLERLASISAEDVARLEEIDQLELEVTRQREHCLSLCRSRELRPIMRQLRAGEVPTTAEGELGVAVAELGRRVAIRRELGLRARERHQAALAENSECLRAEAADPLFREALLWQNRRALETGVASLLRHASGPSNSKTRQNEMLIASYLQRYCAKNDTIGFFGPVGWGEIVDERRGLGVLPGPQLLASRKVYFEHWAIDALAASLAADARLLPDLVPRPAPTLRLEGDILHSGERAIELGPEVARVLVACDGVRSARALASALVADGSLGFGDPDEVYQLLAELADQRIVTWTLEVPPVDQYPERELRRLLERVEDSEARAEALAKLERLEEARADIAAAAGDSERLEPAIDRLQQVFEEVTGGTSTRRGGATYAGRTLFFEDCRRDALVELGGDVARRVGAPLGLVLASARWYSRAIAERYRQAFSAIYRELATSGAVDYLRFAPVADSLFTGDPARPAPLVAEVQRALQERWRDLLRLDLSAARESRSTVELAAGVADRFSAPRAGWPGAKHHSPDMMFAARGAEAVGAGDYLAVLGELHIGCNTLSSPLFLGQHQHPEELIAALDEEIPPPRIAVVVPKQRSARPMLNCFSPHAVDVETGVTRSFRRRENVIAASQLLLEETDGLLGVRSRDGRFAFEVVAFYEQRIMYESVTHFSLLPAAEHRPRVAIDQLVIARESWRMTPPFAFAEREELCDRFEGALRWARDHRMPRQVFARVPHETKPFYVDFHSPILVEMLARQLRKAEWVSVTEMLPSLSESWLSDAAGNYYTSELRMIAVDSR